MFRIILACLLAFALPVSAATLHVGRTLVQTISSSSGVPVPPGSVTAAPVNPAIVTTSVNPANNNVTLGCLTTGNSNVNYAALGFNPVSGSVSCLPAPTPTLVVTDGPEI